MITNIINDLKNEAEMNELKRDLFKKKIKINKKRFNRFMKSAEEEGTTCI